MFISRLNDSGAAVDAPMNRVVVIETTRSVTSGSGILSSSWDNATRVAEEFDVVGNHVLVCNSITTDLFEFSAPSHSSIPSRSTMPRDFDNSPTADIILRSSGPKSVEFRAHRVILSIASPIFETMFSLPQPGGDRSIPVCDLSEDANTVDALLRFVYPVEE